MHPHLRIVHVSKRYQGTQACADVSFELGHEEFLTILGPSGSGKTTLLMMVAGFAMPDSGLIALGDRDITRLPSQQRDLGVVFQNYALFPHLTIFENLAYPLRVRRTQASVIRERVAWALDLMQLNGVGERHPGQLSGGQQQRIAVARAIIFQPRLLLMDEPLGALDKKLRDYMQVELKALQRRLKTAVIYVTHDQGEALSMSDRIAVMDRGRIVQIDTPQALYRQPGSRFVAEFLGETVLIEGRVEAIEPGVAQVRVAAGTVVRARAAQPALPGQAVVVMIRPETITLGGDGENRLEGVIEELTFLGDYTRCRVRTGESLSIAVKHPSHHVVPGLAVGAPVALGWRMQDTAILPGGDDG